jgi:hypothetical protein
MLMKFSDEVGVDASMLRFLLEGKTLEPSKSLVNYFLIATLKVLPFHFLKNAFFLLLFQK